MSSFIGQLRISLGLDSAAFETGAKRASAEVNALGGRAEKAGFAVGQMSKALVAGAAVFAGATIVSQLKAAVTAGLDYAGAIGRAAQISNASAADFQKAAFAARSVGIESEKLADIYKDVNDKVGEFLATGGGEMKDFFTNIAPQVGVTAEQFARLSGPEALQLYVSSLEKAGLSQQQMTFYMEALANDATALLPLLRNNGTAMNDLGKQAERLGIVMDEGLVKKAGEASKTLSDLDSVMKARLAITVSDNTEGVIAYANAYAFLTDKALKALGVLGRMADQAAKNNAGLKDYFNGSGAFGQFRNDLAARPGFAGMLGISVPKPGGPLFPGAAGPLRAALDAFENLPVGLRGSTSRPTSLLDRASPKRGSYRGGGGSSAGRSAGRSAASDELRTLEQTTNEILASFKPFGDRTSEQFKGRAEKRFDEIRVKLGEMSKSTSDAAKHTEAATVRIGRSFADMAQDTVASLQNMSNSIRSGDFLSILGSMVGLFTQFGKVGLFGNAMAVRLNKVPGFANGTNFAPGGLAMVGERGPELVNLPRGAQVYPNGTGPGGGSRPYFDLRGAVVTQDLINQMNAVGAVAAQAGGELGYRKVQRAGSRRLA
jgi:ElaB/YqjD/DUF883 family membrane-anchored ribosome-binding protein